MFASKDVSNFLEKSSEKEDDEPKTVAKEDESSWTVEDDEPAKAPKPADTSSKSADDAKGQSDAAESVAKQQSVNGSLSDKAETPSTPSSTRAKNSTDSPRVTLDDAASLSSSVESVLHSLHSKVEQLTGALEAVIDESKDKDRRIEALEQQLNSLLKK
jgi:hypothetical protein